jgi:hypothetical protein
VRFHANFLCVETVHHEVGCNGVLFNDPYGVPVVALDDAAEKEVGELLTRIRGELAGGRVWLTPRSCSRTSRSCSSG